MFNADAVIPWGLTSVRQPDVVRACRFSEDQKIKFGNVQGCGQHATMPASNTQG